MISLLLVALKRIGAHPGERALPVLMYHSISSDPEPGVPPYYRLCTSLARFAEQMTWLQLNGYQGVTLSEGLQWLGQTGTTGPVPTEPRPVALTFDDGFRDFYSAAWPILRGHGFRATMYLPTAFIGESRRTFHPRGSSGVPGVTGRPCLTWPEVVELAEAGVELGGHTMSHPELPCLSWTVIEQEVQGCKDAIEQRLGRNVRTFAHPYAFPQERAGYAARFCELLQRVGYESGVTTRVGRVRPKASCFTLCRLPINDADDQALFRAKIYGAYDWVGRTQAWVRWIRKRRSTLGGAIPVSR